MSAEDLQNQSQEEEISQEKTRTFEAVEFPESGNGEEGLDLTGRYDIVREVGRGGCAVVYEAIQKASGARVALKVLSVQGQADEKEMHVVYSRFRREARLIASLNESNHIVGLLDSGMWGDAPCMVLEFLDGIGFDSFLRDYTPLPPELAIKIIIQVLQALVVAHGKGVVHRDIKPSNVMLLGDDYDVRVLDFGIASFLDGFEEGNTLLTQQGSIRGTPSYMAPELFAGTQKATPESDLYAVGLMLLECFTGKVTFDGTDFLKIAYSQVNEKIKIPSNVPLALRPIIQKLCDKKRERRYAHATEVIDALLECQGDLKEQPVKRSLKFVIIGVSAVVLILAIAIILSLRPNGEVDFTSKIDQTVSEQYADGFNGVSYWFSSFTKDIENQTVGAWGTMDDVFLDEKEVAAPVIIIEDASKSSGNKTHRPGRQTGNRTSGTASHVDTTPLPTLGKKNQAVDKTPLILPKKK